MQLISNRVNEAIIITVLRVSKKLHCSSVIIRALRKEHKSSIKSIYSAIKKELP